VTLFREVDIMSKNLSLKLQDEIFEETEQVLRKVRRPRNSYINEAVHFYNKLVARRLLKDRLIKESKMVAADSMTVLEEFEKFEESFPGENNGN
jgi:predicted transcriptional regulator